MLIYKNSIFYVTTDNPVFKCRLKIVNVWLYIFTCLAAVDNFFIYLGLFGLGDNR